MKRLLLLAFLFLFCAPAFAGTTYYVCAATGSPCFASDSNAGTSKTVTWLHDPRMSSFTGSYTHAAGDKIIFRGGDTWHYGNSSAAPYFATWTISTSGTSSAEDYLGVDTTWFNSSVCGSAWCRPIITGDNALSTSFVSSCTYDQSTSMGLKLNAVSYLTVDNFEWPGRCWSSTSANSAAIYNYESCNVTLSNNYFHGWTATVGSADDQMVLGNLNGSCGIVTNSHIYSNVFDGSDSSAAAGGSSSCTNAYNPAYPCQSGQGVQIDGAYIYGNVFRYLSNDAVVNNLVAYHDNLAEYLYNSYRGLASPTGPHSNVINDFATSATGSPIYFYNNIVRHNYSSELIYLTVASGSTGYAFNNVFFDNLQYSSSATAPQNCLIFETFSTTGTQTAYIYGNTFDADTDDPTGGGCQVQFNKSGNGGSSPPWNGPGYFENNHAIGTTNLAGLYECASPSSCTIHDNGNELFQATAAARTQGYTQAGTNDGPAQSCTAATCSTLQAGANLSTSISTFSPDLFQSFGFETSLGASENTAGVLTQTLPNTTSSCSQATGSPTAGCGGAGAMPFHTNPANAGAETTTQDPLPGTVSPLSIHTLMYSGFNGWIGCVVLPWFSNKSTIVSPALAAYNGHQNIGMDMSNPAQALAQLQAMKTRGCDTAVIDYYGSTNPSQAYNLLVTETMIAQIAANPSTTPKLLLMLDNGAIDGSASGQCPPGMASPNACIEAALEANLAAMTANWTGQTYYQANSKDSKPIVMYFVTPSLWPAANFSTIYAAVSAAYPGIDFMGQSAGAFGESGIMGGFAWPQPNDWSAVDQYYWDGDGSFDYLGNFYSTAQAQTTSVPDTITCGGLWKGFDDNPASWGSNRVMAQQAGGVVGLTVGKITSSGYSSGLQLSCLLVASWNDYEEGHEIETGIDNTWRVSTPIIAGGNITWSLTANDATYANTNTISSISILTGYGFPSTIYASGISATTTSHAAPTLAAGQSAWVELIGTPLMLNQLSPAVGGKASLYPAQYQNPRPSTWDIGAYQFVPVNPFALNADNLYCPVLGCTPSWGTSDGPAQLPTSAMNTAMANTPAPGSVISVGSTAGDLTAALASAVCGEQLQLTAGAVYTGNFTVPALSCAANNWLWITTSGYSSLPPEQTRISPCYAGIASVAGLPPYACPAIAGTYTAQLTTTNSGPSLTFTSGTNGVRVIGIEFTRASGVGIVYNAIGLGQIGNISNIILDRVLCHGVDTDQTESCMDSSAASNVAIVDSYAYDFFCLSPGACTDSHAFIHGLNAVNSTTESGWKIVNTFDESAGENILTGGGASNTTPSNGEIRLNTFLKRRSWNPADPSYTGGIGGAPYLVKNLFELKNAQKFLVEGNTFQGSWGGFSQSGECWKLIAVNQSNNAPNAMDINLTARYNSCNMTGQWLYGLAMIHTATYLPAAENSISVHDNVADNLNYLTCYSCENNASMVGMWEDATIATSGQIFNNASVTHNTTVMANGAPTLYGFLGISGPVLPSAYSPFNITFSNNIGLSQSPYGTGNVNGGTVSTNCSAGVSGGAPMITPCGYPTVAGNCFIANGSITWPSGNTTSLANQGAAYVNWNNGNAGNYLVASGACKSAATDGTDPGANIAKIAAVMAGATAGFPQIITAVDAPVVSSQENYAAYQALIASPNPLLTAQSPKVSIGNSGGGTLYLDTESSTTAACAPTLTFTQLDAIIAAYPTNPLFQPAAEGETSTATSACVWNQATANAAYLPYTQNTQYLASEYILQGGNYWVLKTGCWTSGYSNFCTTGATPATFSGGIGATVTDGTVVWTNNGPNAPVQDGYCGFGHTCNGANSANPGQTYNINNLGGITLAQLYNAEPVPWELPVRYWYNQNIAAIVAHYNSSPYLSNILYMRFGSCCGAELGGLGVGTWPYGGSSYGQIKAQFISWVGKFDAYIMAQAPLMPIYSDINCGSDVGTNPCDYADQEAILAKANGMAGIGNADAVINDMLNLQGTGSTPCHFPLESALTAGSACTQGNWAYNFATFPTMAHWLQPLNGSTPLDCSVNVPGETNLAGLVGPLAPLPSGTTACPAGTPGMLPFFGSLANAGVGSPNVKIQVNTFEAPISVASGTAPSIPASDVLLALSKTYFTSYGAQSTYLPSQAAYAAAFCTFLGLNCETLTLTLGGTGTVGDNLSQINCPPTTCSATYLNNTSVTLTATAGVGYTFTGWTGAGCSGAGICVVTMSAAKAVTATFTPTVTVYQLTQVIVGSGSVSSNPSGIACPSACTASYPLSTVVTLTETPGAGYNFSAWSGACSGSGSTTTVTMSAAQSCTATFTPIPSYALTVAGSGGLGNITSSPSGISCPSTCVHNFLSGTVVTLTETPIAGYVFSNWSGACSGSGSTTTVTMNAAESCAANFAPNGQGILLNPPFLLQPGSGGILLQ